MSGVLILVLLRRLEGDVHAYVHKSIQVLSVSNNPMVEQLQPQSVSHRSEARSRGLCGRSVECEHPHFCFQRSMRCPFRASVSRARRVDLILVFELRIGGIGQNVSAHIVPKSSGLKAARILPDFGTSPSRLGLQPLLQDLLFGGERRRNVAHTKSPVLPCVL